MFIILTPIFIMLADVFSFMGVYRVVSDPDEFEKYQTTVNLFFSINNFFALMSHQVFGAQYLRTSLVLPKLFKAAKLEWVLSDTQNHRLSESKLSCLREERINTTGEASRSFVSSDSILTKA